MLKNKKGFTLVEIVVVIVIIAILAAILVPNIVRWVDKARLASLKSEADTVRNAVAAQILVEIKDGFDAKGATQNDFGDDFWSELSEEVGKNVQCENANKDGYVTFTVGESGLIEFTYSSGGHTATYDGTTWEYE